MWKLLGDQTHEPYYETLGKSDRAHIKERDSYILENQFGFMLERSTMEAIYLLQGLMEKY